MRWIAIFLISIAVSAVDFDCVVVGTSPFSLFEALYQYHTGNRVLILEEAPLCGGAWKGIDICGVRHADLGCHQIGNDARLKTFLETYAGCQIVSMDNPETPFEAFQGPNGWYFSHGCYELIDNLLKLIALTDIALLNNTRVEKVTVDTAQRIATVQAKDLLFTAQKVIVTPMSCLNLQPNHSPQPFGKSKSYHLYLLIQDPTPPRFSYRGGVASGMSRMMNLSRFVGLIGTGRQLIVIQTYNEQHLGNGLAFLDAMKQNQLVDGGAYILQSEPYIYETGSFHQGLVSSMGVGDIIEILQTGHFQNLGTYIARWERALKPFNDLIK